MLADIINVYYTTQFELQSKGNLKISLHMITIDTESINSIAPGII